MRWGSFAIALSLSGLTACQYEVSADERERQATRVQAGQITAAVGMPSITRGATKRVMKMIYELQDKQQPTTTYIYSPYLGKLFKLCDSFGYPIPYATQYTNPMRVDYDLHGNSPIPQPDPDGLFKPASADGTWVVCVGDDRQPVAVYVEDKVIASPTPLKPLKEVVPPQTEPVEVKVK